MNKGLAIFGPYPPPIGGVSIHISRIEKHLIKQNIDFQIFNHGHASGENVVVTEKSKLWYFKMLYLKGFKAIHFHQFFKFHYLYYWVFSRINSTPIIITIHSERFLFYNSILKKACVYFIKHTKECEVITVSKELYDFFLKNNIKCSYLPAYVPPKPSRKIELKKDNTTIYFAFSIWKCTQELSEDIYDLPLALSFLKLNKSNFKMLLFIGTQEDSDIKYLNTLINKYHLKNHVVILFEKQVVEYVHNCKFLLKTNKKDGYGIALQEAMDLGVPAIATNVCKRPKGTILYNKNDLNGLQKAVEFVLNTPKQEILKEKENLEYHKELILKYKALLYE